MQNILRYILFTFVALVAVACRGDTKPEFLFSLRVVRTFHRLAEFAVMSSETEGTLHIVVKDGMAGFAAGPIIRDERVPLTKDEVEKFRLMLSQVDRSMQVDLPGFTDGSTWILSTDDGIGTARIACISPQTRSKERRTLGICALGDFLWHRGNFDSVKDQLY